MDSKRTEQYNGKGDSDVEAREHLPHWHIENKVSKSPTLSNAVLKKWHEQLLRDVKPHTPFSVILFRANSRRRIAAVPYKVWEQLNIGVEHPAYSIEMVGERTYDLEQMIDQHQINYLLWCRYLDLSKNKDMLKQFTPQLILIVPVEDEWYIWMDAELWLSFAIGIEASLRKVGTTEAVH